MRRTLLLGTFLFGGCWLDGFVPKAPTNPVPLPSDRCVQECVYPLGYLGAGCSLGRCFVDTCDEEARPWYVCESYAEDCLVACPTDRETPCKGSCQYDTCAPEGSNPYVCGQ